MNIGMLWFDDNPTVTITDKVSRAANYYTSKYGCKPNICFINPGMLAGEMKKVVDGIEIKTSRTVLRHHFWLGVQQSTTPA
ncbi:MAG: hypothetical protein JW704_01985 [Anaerolineaceae bacterium]|nr:hypothetical protein [Anaerolineaceae bacterium]MBN2676470.1 hypothetical protein [Anaerolineaceae bacterium]